MPLLACTLRAREVAPSTRCRVDGGQVPVFPLASFLLAVLWKPCLFAPMLAPGQGFRFKVV